MIKSNVGTKIYRPEMGDKTPISEIFSVFSSVMGKFRIMTPIELKGRGIKYYDTYTKDNCNKSSFEGQGGAGGAGGRLGRVVLHGI
jgi:hypothetical protein